jgi:hypothetical protein
MAKIPGVAFAGAPPMPTKLRYGEDMCACCGACFETFGAYHVRRCFPCRMRCNPGAGQHCTVAKDGGE